MAEITERQEKLSNYLLDKKVVTAANTSIDFYGKYGVTLPISDLHEYLEFDKQLAADKYLKTDLVSKL